MAFDSSAELQQHYRSLRGIFYPSRPGFGHGSYRANIPAPEPEEPEPEMLTEVLPLPNRLACDDDAVLDLYQYLCTLEPVPKVRFIMGFVAHNFGLRLNDMARKGRTKDLVAPRHIAMFLCRAITGKSYPLIGQAFGNRDHTTVLHGCEKYRHLIPHLRPEHGKAF